MSLCQTFHLFFCLSSTVEICKIVFVFSNMIQHFLYLCILIPCVSVYCCHIYIFKSLHTFMGEHFLIILFQIDSLEIINKAKGLQFILICSALRHVNQFI